MSQVDDTHDLLAPYALGALDEDERRSFERHLDECSRCREVLPTLLDAASSLALAAEPAEPPPSLRKRILAQARSGPAAAEPRARVVRRFRLTVPTLAGFAVAAACAAVGLLVWALSLHGSLSRERDAQAAQRAALAVLADPAARRVPLAGRSGVLAVRPDGTAALAVNRLGRAARGKTYEAWVIQGRTPRRAGLFRGEANGETLFTLDRRVPHDAVVAVTVEPAAGVAQPTTKPILSASA